MALPSTVTMKNLSGKYSMNKSLSDDVGPVLALQGIGWFLRKTITLANLSVDLKHYVDDKGVTHIDIANTLSGGIKGTSEERTLDNQWRGHTDYIFGTVNGRSRWIKLSDLDENDEDQKYLKEGWAKEIDDEEVIESFVENEEAGWTGWQIWALIDDKDGKGKRYARHAVVRKGDEVKRMTMVYDWLE